jgi:hypothetical protein
VTLLRAERLAMVALGAIGEPPCGGEHAGAWLEVLDDADRVIFHRLLRDPFALRAEHHSPDDRIEVHARAPEPTDFEVVLPALPGADSLRLWAMPPAARLAAAAGARDLRASSAASARRARGARS